MIDNKEYHMLPGIAHFIEHTLLEKSPFGNIIDIYSDRNYIKNGLTGYNKTEYFFYGIDNIKDSIKKLITTIDMPIFTKEDIEVVRKPILVETKNGTNNYNKMLGYLAVNNTYKNINIFDDSLNSIGTEDDNKNITFDMLKTCYQAFYRDDNKEIVIAGNINEKDIINYLEDIYKNIPQHKCNTHLIIPKDLNTFRKKEDTIYFLIKDDKLSVSYKFKAKSKKDIEKINEYLFFIEKNLFGSSSSFIEGLINEGIIYKNPSIIFNNSIDKYINTTMVFETKDVFKLKDKLKTAFKNLTLSQDDFNIYIKERIAREIRDANNLYSLLISYGELENDYNELINSELLKSLNYNDFLEFYNNTSFDDYSIAITTGKK